MTTLDELQARCARTTLTKLRPDATHRERVAMAALWLTSEAGEVADEVRRYIDGGVDEHAVDCVRVELGDVLWCVAEVATLLGLTLEDCAASQKRKQEDRYENWITLHDTEGR